MPSDRATASGWWSTAFSLENLQGAIEATSGAAQDIWKPCADLAGKASSVAHQAIGSAAGAALGMGSVAQQATSDIVASLQAEDPEDVQGTVTCSELAGPLRIKPGSGKLVVVSAWFGHPSDPEQRRDITAEAQSRVSAVHSLELPVSTSAWGVQARLSLSVLSVSYKREDCREATPGELLRLSIARSYVATALERASFEALKQVVGSPAKGCWIHATPMIMGVPVPGKCVHAIYVSSAELIFWSPEEGIRCLSYLGFLQEIGVAELQVAQRPVDNLKAQEVVDCARSLLAAKAADSTLEEFDDSSCFACHCHGSTGGADVAEIAKKAGTLGAAALVAAHVDEAAAVVTLPIMGAQAAVAVGFVGAVVVSPLLLAGIWHVQRCNDARLGLAVINLTKVQVSLSIFELDDSHCMEWGPFRSSCAGLGGCSSINLQTNQLLELNPPSSSDVFQLHCVAAQRQLEEEMEEKEGVEEDKAHNGREHQLLDHQASQASKLAERNLAKDIDENVSDWIDNDIPCVQSVQRGRIYWVLNCESALVIREVPRRLIPAFAGSNS